MTFNITMKLLNEYLVLPRLESGQKEWLKLELYFDHKKGCIFPKLYARDEFLVKRHDRFKKKVSKEWFWFEECGWFFPLDSYILTDSETEALNVVEQYIECKWKGNSISAELENKIKAYPC